MYEQPTEADGPDSYRVSFELGALITKHLANELSEEEQQRLDAWLAESDNNRQFFQQVTDQAKLSQQLAVFNSVDKQAARKKMDLLYAPVFASPFRIRPWRTLAIAACITALLSAGGYWWFTQPPQAPGSITVTNKEQATPVNDIPAPAGNKAILRLADNSVIVLDSAHGLVAQQAGSKVINENGSVSYTKPVNLPKQVQYNTLSIPRGAEYSLTLSDHSKVFLNAESSIRYPTVFVGKERRVEITGEVYFEITQAGNGEGRIPFIVDIHRPSGDGGSVEVLGTHFNINAYPENATVNTTLLQGRVKVTGGEADGKSLVLQPGQQAQVSNAGSMKLVAGADLAKTMAWRKGVFMFDNDDIETVMNQVARWYDVDIVYEGPKPTAHFSGAVSRNNKASTILKVLGAYNVNFTIQGRTIIVKR